MKSVRNNNSEERHRADKQIRVKIIYRNAQKPGYKRGYTAK